MRITSKDKKRFWDKVVVLGEDDCWEWQAAKINTGYGSMSFPTDGVSWDSGSTPKLAHRISWSIQNGDIPKGLCVLHSCDNKGCVNPSHLRSGTYKDNNADMMRRGRQNNAYGERIGSAKLTWEIVAEIRASDLPTIKLASIYDVSKNTIWAARSGLYWATPDQAN